MKYENSTISVPRGTSYQRSTDTYCVPSRWYDIAAFFLANYVTHAATVKSLPGEPTVSAIMMTFFALLFPASGAMRALSSIRWRAEFYSDPLTAAARAGALCTVVRTEKWKLRDGETVQGCSEVWRRPLSSNFQRGSSAAGDRPRATDLSEQDHDQWYQVTPLEYVLFGGPNISGNSGRTSCRAYSGWWFERASVEPLDIKVGEPNKEGQNIFHPSIGRFTSSGRKVHGTCCLPQGYGLMIVPSNALVVGLDGTRSEKNRWTTDTNQSYNQLNPSYSLAKPLVAILQVICASFTLYRTQGNQLDKYGYAAFDLTIASYLVMSVLNFISSTLTADYSSVFLVETDIMKEAASREGARFEGMVGKAELTDAGYGTQTFEARFIIDAGTKDYA